MKACMRRSGLSGLAIILALVVPGVVWAQDAPAAQEKSAREALDRGVKFLESKMQPDGTWNKEPGVNGMVILALLKSGRTTADPTVKTSLEALLKFEKADGGIYDQQIANYSTGVAVQVLAAAKDPKYKATLAKARAFLLGAQMGESNGHPQEDPNYGGLSYGGAGRGPGRADLSNTQMWADAMKDLEKSGLEKDSEAWKRAVAFISRCQNRSESNNAKVEGVTWTDDGGATYGPFANRQYLETLPDGRKILRSYGSMTYAFLKCMIYADVKRDDPRVQAAVGWIRKNYTLDENPGVGQQGLFYYYHTMAKALKAVAEPALVDDKGVSHDWRADLTKKTLSLQSPDGSWSNKNDRWFESDPVLVTAYSVLTLNELLAK